MVLLVLLGAFFVLFAVNREGLGVVAHELRVLLFDTGAAFIFGIVGFQVGNAVAALGGDPLEVRERLVDRVLLNRVNLIDQLIRVVYLIS